MSPIADAALTHRLLELAQGYRITQVLAIAVRLEIAERLADGPRDTAELAAAAGVHEPSLFRLLRAFTDLGLVSRVGDRRFALTPLGACLAAGHESSARARVLLHAEQLYGGWPDLLATVRTGENRWQRLHGADVWTLRAGDVNGASLFDDAMQEGSSQRARAVVAAYDFSPFGTVVDVGGGRGSLLAGILASFPGVRGVLFDQPHVVAGVGDLLRKAGVADRCAVVGGSFFERVPEGGDAYLLKAILHDWEDDAAIAILQACRRAIRPGRRLLVLERLIAPPNEMPDAKFSDLNMMVSPGGQERTREEFAALFAAAQFRLVGVAPTGTRLSVIEGLPA